MATRPDDDLFSGTTMSFGSHLEELRVALFRSLIGLVLGFLIGLGVATQVVKFMEGPLKTSLEEFYRDKAMKLIHENYSGVIAEEMLTTITEEGLIPDVDIKIEPQGFLRNLMEIDPEQFSGIQYRPHRFILADVIDANFGALAAQLKSEGEGPSGVPGKRLWLLMNDEQRTLVKRLAGKKSVPQADQIALVEVLNQLADMPEVHRSEEFQEKADTSGASTNDTSNSDTSTGDSAATQTVKTNQASEEIRASLREEFDADLSRRLNKRLISAALDQHLRAPRMVLISVPTWKPVAVRVQSLGAHEAFMIWLKAGFISGLIITSPWIFWQIWHFVGAGLYPHEKKYIYIYLPFSLLLFIAGASLAFFGVFRHVLKFLFHFNEIMDIDPDPRISEWLGFVMILPLGFGVSFQLPLVMLFLNRLGIFSVEVYLAKWRIAVLVIFVISMLLTPADPISMLMMAGPLTVLYFGGVALCKWMPRGRSLFDEAYEPE